MALIFLILEKYFQHSGHSVNITVLRRTDRRSNGRPYPRRR